MAVKTKATEPAVDDPQTDPVIPETEERGILGQMANRVIGQREQRTATLADGTVVSLAMKRLLAQHEKSQYIGATCQIFALEDEYAGGRMGKKRVPWDPQKHRGQQKIAEVLEFSLIPVGATPGLPQTAETPKPRIWMSRNGNEPICVGLTIAAGLLQQMGVTIQNGIVVQQVEEEAASE